jgi:serine/threonine-protein kinase
MATVYLADDLKHQRKVALKVLKPELAAVVGAERFLAEIKTTANLQHPHILPLFDSGEADSFLFYVMPYVEGESLREKLDREHQLSVDEALKLTTDIAEALQAAHEQGVIHRDIKPANILLSRGSPLLSDFGIALAVSSAGGDRLTETGLSMGTPHYMSPEQAAGESHIDARSDIYSLAAMLYEMLAGEPPYTGRTAQVVLTKRLTDPVPSVRRIRDKVPASIDVAIRQALAAVPADRFATVAQFRDGLSRYAPAVETPAPHRGVRWRTTGVMAAVAILVVVAVWQLASGGRDAPPLVLATVEPLTTDPGVEWFPSLSPDGEWVVYGGQASGNWDIYLKSVGGQNPINLTQNSLDDDDQPAFSPDGQRIAFRSSRGGGGIFVMGRTGEAVRRVTRRGYKPTWSPDGTELAYATENVEMNPQNSEGRSQLWVVGVASGEERQIEVFDAVLPSWSPNGHRIAYFRRLDFPERGVWTVPAEGGEEIAVTDHLATDWNPTWSLDGEDLYFASDRSGSMNLWRVPIDEQSGETRGDPEPITTPAVSLGHISLSADGRRVVYSSEIATTNIQGLAFDPESRSVVGEPVGITSGSRRWSSPDPSPDGEWVAFYSLVVPEGDVYVIRADGTGLRLVTGDDAIDRVPRWSPDGDWLAFFSDRAGASTIWKIRADGSDLRQLTSEAGGVPVWSPDGSQMVGRPLVGEDMRSFLFDPTRPTTSGASDRLPDPEPALTPFIPHSWSPNGEYLAGDVGYDDIGIVVYAFQTRTYERLTDFGQWPVWLPDGRHILFVSGGKKFFVIDRESKEVQEIYSATWDVIGPPRLTLDGLKMYYSRRSTQADLWLVTLQ